MILITIDIFQDVKSIVDFEKRSDVLAELILKQFDGDKNIRILDVGCGVGLLGQGVIFFIKTGFLKWA